MKRTLADWLDYQLHTHPQGIAMGLDRVRDVAQRLGLGKPGRHVITVAGTNGKGSTVAFIEAIARAQGLHVGAFTSPHLLRYNERVRVAGQDMADERLVEAFEAIEVARCMPAKPLVPLTYFEFGTLAALWLFERADLDLAILEVGLGGRLDAVNIIDADVAVITSVDLDHQEYLGLDRESIGAEKAGIMRAGRPCVLGEKDPPTSVLRRAYEIGAFAIRGHCDYLMDALSDGWRWREPGFEIDLPHPRLAASAQRENAAAAIAALRASGIALDDGAIRQGVRSADLPGRLQIIARQPDLVLDVAHNPQAARQLAAWLAAHPKPTVAVFSALADKDVIGLVEPVKPHILGWHLGPILDAGMRGLSAEALAGKLAATLAGVPVQTHAHLSQALTAARAGVGQDHRVLVFGSFHTVAQALQQP